MGVRQKALKSSHIQTEAVSNCSYIIARGLLQEAAHTNQSHSQFLQSGTPDDGSEMI